MLTPYDLEPAASDQHRDHQLDNNDGLQPAPKPSTTNADAASDIRGKKPNVAREDNFRPARRSPNITKFSSSEQRETPQDYASQAKQPMSSTRKSSALPSPRNLPSDQPSDQPAQPEKKAGAQSRTAPKPVSERDVRAPSSRTPSGPSEKEQQASAPKSQAPTQEQHQNQLQASA